MLKVATKEDLPYVLNFARHFCETNLYKDIKFDEEKVTLFLLSIIGSKDKVIICLLNEDTPVGALIAASEEIIFGRDKIATEIMFWVDEEFRGKNSWELIDGYLYWAKMLNCTLCSLSSVEGELVDKLDIKYKQLGFTPVERTYLKVL